MKSWKLLLFLLCLSESLITKAQQEYFLEIKTPAPLEIFKKSDYKKTFSTKTELLKECQKILLQLHENAYLAASFDSTKEDSTHVTAFLNPGKMYQWAFLKRGNVDEGILSEIGFREKLYQNKPLYFKEIVKVQEKILDYCEDNGFPFASIKLDSIDISDNMLSAQLHLTKNIELHIDSIIIKGTANIAPVYLYNYLSIKPGDYYNETLIKKVSTRLKEISFLKENKPSIIAFTDKYSKLLLFLENRNASQFDGIVGLLSDNTTNKIMLTGDVRLKLQNSIGRGELIDLNWRRLQANTQDLTTKFTYPFLFSSPFGLDYNFKLYKKDTLYIDVIQNLAIQYLLNGGSYFKVFVNSKKSTQLSTNGMEFQTTLPNYADISTTLYGLGYKTERLDYCLNPRKGYTLIFNAGAGNKNIKKNDKLNPKVYENVKTNSAQYSTDFDVSVYLPIKNRSTIKFQNRTAYLTGTSTFQNELFRIGGLKTLRGFDEESINASAYSIFTMEYRYILEQNSHLFLFFDGAYYENKNITSTFVKDTPYGFGSGISFQTKAGIFSINYALGKQFNNPLYLKSGKIHFGIVNYF